MNSLVPLRVLIKIFDDLLCHFYMGVRPPSGKESPGYAAGGRGSDLRLRVFVCLTFVENEINTSFIFESISFHQLTNFVNNNANTITVASDGNLLLSSNSSHPSGITSVNERTRVFDGTARL